jgi:hypothetical protein
MFILIVNFILISWEYEIIINRGKLWYIYHGPYTDYAMGWITKVKWFDSWEGHEGFFCFQSRLVLGPTQPLTHRVLWALSPRALPTHFHLVPMLHMSAATPPLPIYFKDMQRETLTLPPPFLSLLSSIL